MPKFNQDILIKNINQLMKERNVNQNNLAEALNISQPSISKCLNGKQSLSIDFVYNIASYFKTSIDALCSDSSGETASESKEESFSKPEKISTYDVCHSLVTIFKSTLPYTKKIVYKESTYLEIRDDYGEGTGMFYPDHEKENVYASIFFSNYEDVRLGLRSLKEDEDVEEYMTILQECGNTNERNVIINTFLDQLIDLLEIFRKGSMTYEAYIHSIDANLTTIFPKCI